MLEHRLAQLAVAATFLLLIIGGTVNPTGSSLACPEPTMICKGELLPEMTGGVLYEHGHRLAAMTVGFVQIALTTMLLLRRRKLIGLGVGLLVMVCVQGALGAITVAYKLPWFVSTGHLLLAMTYFATLLYTVYRTRPVASDAVLAERSRGLTALGAGRRWILVAVVAVFIQLALGALVRHFGAALACLDMPTCQAGAWFPDAWIQRLHMIHRSFGVVVGVVTTIAAIQVLRRARGWTALRRLMMAAPVLVGLQITLGIFTVLTMRSVPVAVAHFGGAAAMWGLWMWAWFSTSGIEQAAAVVRPALAPVRGVHVVP